MACCHAISLYRHESTTLQTQAPNPMWCTNMKTYWSQTCAHAIFTLCSWLFSIIFHHCTAEMSWRHGWRCCSCNSICMLTIFVDKEAPTVSQANGGPAWEQTGRWKPSNCTWEAQRLSRFTYRYTFHARGFVGCTLAIANQLARIKTSDAHNEESLIVPSISHIYQTYQNQWMYIYIYILHNIIYVI